MTRRSDTSAVTLSVIAVCGLLIALAMGVFVRPRAEPPRLAVAPLPGAPEPDPCLEWHDALPPHDAGPGTDPIVIVCVGDTLLGDLAQPMLESEGWDYPFRRLRALLTRGDLLIGNLEAPITECSAPFMSEKRWSYRQSRDVAAACARAGFGGFSLANNHAMDFGPEGLADTMRSLHQAGIKTFGAGPNAGSANAGIVVRAGGVAVGIAGWMQLVWKMEEYGAFATVNRPGVAVWDESVVPATLSKLRECSDLVIVNMHWGKNYSPVTDAQINMGRRLIDWGADVVVGHHPHIAQGVEVYAGRPILYSVGNFTFGTRGRFGRYDVPGYGLVAGLIVENTRLARVELDVIAVDNERVEFQPTPVRSMEARQALEPLMLPFGTALRWNGTRAIIDLPDPDQPDESAAGGAPAIQDKDHRLISAGLGGEAREDRP